MPIMKKVDLAVKFIAMGMFILESIHKIKNMEKAHSFGLVSVKIQQQKIGIKG